MSRPPFMAYGVYISRREAQRFEPSSPNPLLPRGEGGPYLKVLLPGGEGFRMRANPRPGLPFGALSSRYVYTVAFYGYGS